MSKTACHKYYTIQHLSAYELAVARGYLTATEQFVDTDFKPSYLWLMAQMHKRLPHYDGTFPIWLWPKRPDLRQHMYDGIPNDYYVLLEITLDPSLVLGSDFDAWHYVLNRWVLGWDDEVIEMEKSWERIFDYDFLKRFDDREIEEQFVTGTIDMKAVKKLKQFRIKGRTIANT